MPKPKAPNLKAKESPNMSTARLISTLTLFTTTALSTGISFAEPSDCAKLRTLLEPSPMPIPVPATEATYRSRSCIKSYPWPNGKSFETVTSAREMKTIKENVADLAKAYLRTHAIISPEVDMQRAIIAHSVHSPDWLRQTLLYGETLHVLLLAREGRHADVIKEVARLRVSKSVKARQTTYDEGDEHTYFSAESLGNILVQLEYTARGNTAKSRRDALAAIQSYAKEKRLLAACAQFSDARGALLEAAGCAEE